MAVYLGFGRDGRLYCTFPRPRPRPPALHGHTSMDGTKPPHPFLAASRMKLMPTGDTNIPHPACMIHLAISPRVSSALLTVYPSSCSALAWLNRLLEASTPTE